jgi:hypothetical protein
MPWERRYRQTASLIANTWASLKVRAGELPRCPEVPNETRCSATEGSGWSS